MATKNYSCSFIGLKCHIIEVQADISNGLPSFSIVGLGDTSVQESKERVRSSIKNSEAKFPVTRKTVNLAPAQLKKQGSLFDLPIAVSILEESEQIPKNYFKDSIIIGELSLTGQIKAIHGALPITQHAKQKGFKRIFLPKANALEASFIDNIEIYPLETLKELIQFTKNIQKIHPQPNMDFQRLQKSVDPKNINEFTKIIGMDQTKRALIVAAAGGHNVLMEGSPGCGKTVIARAFKNILPPMTKTEVLETTKIFSVAGLLTKENRIILERPFREVHHSATIPAIIGGGGNTPKPGEITLAHNGVLFLDEIAEFQKTTLETLRQPLEDKFVTIARANFSLKFPSNFILIATMNPCPCGFFRDKKNQCKCSESQIRNYQRKLSGPLLDRFDLFVQPEKFAMKNIFKNHPVSENSPDATPDSTNDKAREETGKLKDLIIQTQKIQTERFMKNKNVEKNSDMTLSEIKKHCNMGKSANTLLGDASDKLQLSNRGYLRTIKIARTIADLEESEQIAEHHIAEALQFRKKTFSHQ